MAASPTQPWTPEPNSCYPDAAADSYEEGSQMRGRCLCGAVSFEAEIKGRGLYQCHCSLCRRQSGAASNAATVIPLASFRWLSGEELITKWAKRTGFRSHFCSTCGSPVPNQVQQAELMWIPAGLLEGADDMRVVAHMQVSSAAGWDPRPENGLIYEEDPDPAEISAALFHGPSTPT